MADLPSVAAAALAVVLSQQQRCKLLLDEIDKELHLHFWWRACWGTIEKNVIATAACFARNKPMYLVTEEKL